MAYFKSKSTEDSEEYRWKRHSSVSAKFDYLAQFLHTRAEAFPHGKATADGWSQRCGTNFDEFLNRPGYGATLAAGSIAANSKIILAEANDDKARLFIGKRGRAWAADTYLSGVRMAATQVADVLEASGGKRPAELVEAGKSFVDAVMADEQAG